MAQSSRVSGVSINSKFDYRPKHNFSRCTDPESFMGDKYPVEPSVRYSNRKPTVGAKQREWAQSRGMGRDTGMR